MKVKFISFLRYVLFRTIVYKKKKNQINLLLLVDYVLLLFLILIVQGPSRNQMTTLENPQKLMK